VLEDEKQRLESELSELRSRLHELDAARHDAQRHCHELNLNLKSTETERSLLTASVNDLHTTLTQADDTLQLLRTENFALKQKVVCSF